MDFGALGKSLGGGASGLNGEQLVKEFIGQIGVQMSASDIKGLANNPTIKQAVMSAVQAMIMKKMTGGGATPPDAKANLMTVAQEIKNKAPDTKLSQQDIAGKLEGFIKQKI